MYGVLSKKALGTLFLFQERGWDSSVSGGTEWGLRFLHVWVGQKQELPWDAASGGGGHPGSCLPHHGRAGEKGLQTRVLPTSGT